jgi:hypothetical protein
LRRAAPAYGKRIGFYRTELQGYSTRFNRETNRHLAAIQIAPELTRISASALMMAKNAFGGKVFLLSFHCKASQAV